MIIEATATGSTVDEAKEAAVVLLAADPEADIQFEIIDLPQKKTFGLFGGCPAKVRAYYDDGKPDQAELERQQRLKAEQAAKEQAKQEQKRREQELAKQAPRACTSPAAPSKEQTGEAVKFPANDRPAVTKEQRDAAANAAIQYLSNLLRIMEIEAQFTVNELENGVEILIEGEHIGPIVGRRGETLDALQYLAVLAANRREAGYCRITLNTGNYREKREKTLQALARRMANQTLRTGRNASLEPMNPYERRIIHTAVQDIKGVSSWSVGEEPNRRVVIGAQRDGSERRYRDNKSRNSRPPRRDFSRGPRQDTPKADAPVREAKKDLDNAPLYGRIDQK